ERLESDGFSWNGDGKLVDRQGWRIFDHRQYLEWAAREEATIISDDLGQLGMNVHVVALEFRAVVDRVFQSNNYEASILGLGLGDTDPNPEMNVWLSSGATHI